MNDFETTKKTIEVKGLTKIYSDGNRKLTVLNDIHFSVEQGAGVCVLGPSGSGKTTLLNILSGLDKPTSGHVQLLGQDITRMNEKEKAIFRNKEIGFVFQFYHLISELSALENVILPALMGRSELSKEELRRKAAMLLQKLGLRERLHHFPAELSGGEQQRVAIARALMNNPSFLFCDEPTGNLDKENGQMIVDLLKDLFQKDKKTVLIVTHDERIARITEKVWNISTNEWYDKNHAQFANL